MNRTSIETYNPRAVSAGDLRDQPPSLNLIEVSRSDAGLYFCVGRKQQLSVTSRVLRLSVEGPSPLCPWVLRPPPPSAPGSPGPSPLGPWVLRPLCPCVLRPLPPRPLGPQAPPPRPLGPQAPPLSVS
ncbi:unnamed protein product [Gadus morhua 'NCC']